MPAQRVHASQAEKQRAYRERQKAAILAALQAKEPRASPLPTMPGSRRWHALREQAERIIETIVHEMETYRDDRSEGWKQSERAETLEETIETLREACDLLQSLD